MPNAKDTHEKIPHRILVLGGTGAGKTTQFLTLPGKKFAYLFDPNAILSLQGHDVDYEEFLPGEGSFDIQSLEKKDGVVKRDNVMGKVLSDVYVNWEKDFDTKMEKGFFKEYDWLCLDSATLLLELIMERLLSINGRPGTFPQQDDYGPQMVAFTNIIRTLTGMGIGLYITGHLKTDKDELTQRIVQLPLMTGQLREKIPLLFSDVFRFEAVTDETAKKVVHQMRTMPNQRETPIRTSIKGLQVIENISIDFSKEVVGQGLGGLLKGRAVVPAIKK